MQLNMGAKRRVDMSPEQVDADEYRARWGSGLLLPAVVMGCMTHTTTTEAQQDEKLVQWWTEAPDEDDTSGARPDELAVAMRQIQDADPLLVDAMALPLMGYRGVLRMLGLQRKPEWIQWLRGWQRVMLRALAGWAPAAREYMVQYARAQGLRVQCPEEEEMVRTHSLQDNDTAEAACPACRKPEGTRCGRERCRWCGACRWAATLHYCPDPGPAGVEEMQRHARRRQAVRAAGAFVRADIATPSARIAGHAGSRSAGPKQYKRDRRSRHNRRRRRGGSLGCKAPHGRRGRTGWGSRGTRRGQSQ